MLITLKKKSLESIIKILGRKMYLAYFSLRFLSLFIILVLIFYLIYPDRMKETIAFVTAVISSFTSIILGAIGANYLISKSYTGNKNNESNITQDLGKEISNDSCMQGITNLEEQKNE